MFVDFQAGHTFIISFNSPAHSEINISIEFDDSNQLFKSTHNIDF